MSKTNVQLELIYLDSISKFWINVNGTNERKIKTISFFDIYNFDMLTDYNLANVLKNNNELLRDYKRDYEKAKKDYEQIKKDYDSVAELQSLLKDIKEKMK